MSRRWIAPLILAVVAARPAHAQEVIPGWQIAVNQSAATTITDEQQGFAGGGQDPNAPVVIRLNGVQLTTGVNANFTFDIITRTFTHAFLLGAAVNQLVPTGLPDTANPEQGESATGVNATATYAARIERPRWAFSLGGGYTFGSNAVLGADDAGGTGGTGGDRTGATTGAAVGPFLVNGTTHTVDANTQYQLLRQNWDLTLGVNYAFSVDALFNAAPGALGAQGGTAGGTAIGAFVPVTTHTALPNIAYRQNIGRRGLLNINAETALTFPLAVQPVELENGETLQPPQIVAPSILTTTTFGYSYELGDQHALGFDLNGALNFRVPLIQDNTNVGGEPVLIPADGGYALDTLIYQARVTYTNFLRVLELQVAASAGAAQAYLWQFPIGVGNGEVFVSPTISNIEPVFLATLTRRFEPIDLTGTVSREVAIGGLGASAIVTEQATLTLGYQLEVGRVDPLTFGVNIGGTAARIRSAGSEFLPEGDVVQGEAAAALNNNDNIGAVAQLTAPIYQDDRFNIGVTLAYNFNFNNLNPDGRDDLGLNQDTTTIHNFVATLDLAWGRGPLANVGNNTGELDAFSQNPSTGSPLTSARLLSQGARTSRTDGSRPGRPPPERRDSRQAYRVNQQQQQAEAEARANNEAMVQGQTGVQSDTGQIGTLDEELKKLEETEAEQEEELDRPAPPPPPPPEEEPAPEAAEPETTP